jgi:hypothetical protein
MFARVPRRLRVRALRGVLEAARHLERVSLWLVRRVNDVSAPDDARDLTAWRYAEMREYRARWHRESGLFDFERDALQRFFPRPPAHLLVHGAGGGREIHALLELGYGVTAAEPVPSLAAAARQAFGARARVVDAGLETPGASELRGPFEGVVVGWSAYGHLVDRDMRVRALRTLRAECPHGPVLLSWREGPAPGLRGSFQTVSAGAGQGASKPSRVVSHFGLFHAVLGESDLRDEARAAGYDVSSFGSYGDQGYPNAVLRPRVG